MKLVLVNRRLGYSSTTSYSFELTCALKERGHDLRLCTSGGELREQFQHEDIESYTVKYNFFSFRKLLEFLRDFEPDLIHVHSLRSLSMGLRIAEPLKTRCVVSVHHVPTHEHEELRHPLIAGAIATSEVVREALVNSQRVSKELVRVIRTGVNLDRFKPGEPPMSRPDGIPVVGAIGRLGPRKGFEYLISAARLVLNQGREAMFAIVGEGEVERSLRNQVKELNLEKQVTFCPPLSEDVAEIIRNFDIVVVPTQRGGIGLIAMEAMAMERPVIASAVGELLQLIGDGKTGLLVNEQDSKAIAEKILYLLDHADEAKGLGKAAREWVAENLPLNATVDATEQYYEQVLEE